MILFVNGEAVPFCFILMKKVWSRIIKNINYSIYGTRRNQPFL